MRARTPIAELVHRMLCAHIEAFGPASMPNAIVVAYSAKIRNALVDELKPDGAIVLDYDAPLRIDAVPVRVTDAATEAGRWPVNSPFYVVSRVLPEPAGLMELTS